MRHCATLTVHVCFTSRYRDPGYRTYVGFLLLDYHHCNPVAITFNNLLVRRANRTRAQRKDLARLIRDNGRTINAVDSEMDTGALLEGYSLAETGKLVCVGRAGREKGWGWGGRGGEKTEKHLFILVRQCQGPWLVALLAVCRASNPSLPSPPADTQPTGPCQTAP